jgi:omega-6 fatty acid desaturase (delta-12 desaturase)
LETCRSLASLPASHDARSWTQILARYREPSHARSIVEIAVTLLPLAALWGLAWAALHFGYWWLSLLLAVPAAGFLVRLFMIQHDCGHGAFFRHRLANDWVGRVLGVLTLTPYDFWRRTHAIHHASSGHLERRGIGDVDTLTVDEYLALSFLGRVCYRMYRPICSSSSIGCRSAWSAGAGSLGSAPWRPISRSPPSPPD